MDKSSSKSVSLHSSFTDHILKHLQLFLYQENFPQFYLFFFFYLLGHFNLISSDAFTNNLLFIATFSLSVISGTNFYFYYVSILKIQTAIFMGMSMLLGICNLNQPYKVFIFIFTVNFHLRAIFPEIMGLHQIVTALLFCLHIYRNMSLNSIANNIKYFVGFSVIAMLNILEQLCVKTQTDGSVTFMLVLLLLTASFAYCLIRRKIQFIESMDLQQIENPRIFYFKILLFQNNQNLTIKFLKEHSRKCEQLLCFCQIHKNFKKDAKNSQIHCKVINYMYLHALDSHCWEVPEKVFLMEKYVYYLLAAKQSIKGYRIASCVPQTKNEYFVNVIRFRMWEKVRQHLQMENYFLKNRKNFEKVYLYDLSTGFVKSQIFEILSGKINFWSELCKASPELITLEKDSQETIDKIQNLHEFFSLEVYPTEKQNYHFTCTIMYSAYLTLTTNYSEYAEQLLKNIENTVSQISFNTAIEVKGIEMSVDEQIQKNNKFLHILKTRNISSSLATALRKQKNQLLNENTDEIFPSYYRDVHLKHFDRWIRYSSFNSERSRVLNTVLEIPFKISDSYIYFSGFEVRITVHFLRNQLSFQAILFQNERNPMKFMTNLQGTVIYRQMNVKQSILEIPEIFEVIRQMKNNYEQKQSTELREVDLQYKENSYHFSFEFFFDKALKANGKQPLILVKYEDENFKFQKAAKQHLIFRPNIKDAGNPKSLKNEINQNQSQSSMESRKDAVENIVNILEKNRIWGKHQVPFRVFLVFVTIFTVVIIMLERYTFIINTSSQPLRSFTLSYEFITYFSNTISFQKDIQLYQSDDPQYVRLLNKIVLGQDYISTTNQRIRKIGIKLQQQILTEMLGSSDFFNTWMKQQLKQKIEIVRTSDTLLEESTRFMQVQQIIMKMVVEMRYFGKQPYARTLLSTIFMDKCLPVLNEIKYQAQSVLQEQQSTDLRNNIIIAIISAIVLFLLNFPFVKLLQFNKNKKLQVFTLLADLNSEIIFKQITKLKKLKSKILNQPSAFEEQNNIMQKKEPSKRNNSVIMKDFINFMLPQNKKQKKISRSKTIIYNLRTRPGDLEIKGSECDPQRFETLQCLFLVFMLIFIIGIAMILMIKIQTLSKASSIKQSLQFHLNQVKGDSLELFAAKEYFDDYELDSKLTFLDEDIAVWLQNSLVEQYLLDAERLTGIKQAQLLSCIENKLICLQNHSYSILRGMLKKGVYDSFNLKHQLLLSQQANQNYTSPLIPQQIRAELFIAQQALQRLIYISSDIQESIFADLQELENSANVQFQYLTNFFWIVLVGFIVYSLVIFWVQKKKYVRNIILLSFVNREMVYRNKRVESFVDRLSKQYR